MTCNKNWLPPWNCVHQDNQVEVNGKKYWAFEEIPVVLLKTIQDRRVKYKKGSTQNVMHPPGSTEWYIVANNIYLKMDAVEGVDFEFVKDGV